MLKTAKIKYLTSVLFFVFCLLILILKFHSIILSIVLSTLCITCSLSVIIIIIIRSFVNLNMSSLSPANLYFFSDLINCLLDIEIEYMKRKEWPCLASFLVQTSTLLPKRITLLSCLKGCTLILFSSTKVVLSVHLLFKYTYSSSLLGKISIYLANDEQMLRKMVQIKNILAIINEFLKVFLTVIIHDITY